MPVIHVELLAGRSADQKRELAAVLTRETARIAKCDPAVVDVIITDIQKENWASGGQLYADKK